MKASFFVESHAIDDTCTPPVLKLPKKKAVRKIGHGIHLVSQCDLGLPCYHASICSGRAMSIPPVSLIAALAKKEHVSGVLSCDLHAAHIMTVASSVPQREVQTVHRFNPPLALGVSHSAKHDAILSHSLMGSRGCFLDVPFKVDRHQDSVTLTTDPISVVGMWLSLEALVTEQKLGKIKDRVRRTTTAPKAFLPVSLII
eukprot:3873281-Amphidinium_carterae.1